MRSDAIGLATAEALSERVDVGELRLLSFVDLDASDPDLQLQYGIVSRVGGSLTPAAQAMIDAILKVDQQLLAGRS
ncbi:hypothetical protein D3C84_1268140 [compost metagenome]